MSCVPLQSVCSTATHQWIFTLQALFARWMLRGFHPKQVLLSTRFSPLQRFMRLRPKRTFNHCSVRRPPWNRLWATFCFLSCRILSQLAQDCCGIFPLQTLTGVHPLDPRQASHRLYLSSMCRCGNQIQKRPPLWMLSWTWSWSDQQFLGSKFLTKATQSPPSQSW